MMWLLMEVSCGVVVVVVAVVVGVGERRPRRTRRRMMLMIVSLMELLWLLCWGLKCLVDDIVVL